MQQLRNSSTFFIIFGHWRILYTKTNSPFNTFFIPHNSSYFSHNKHIRIAFSICFLIGNGKYLIDRFILKLEAVSKRSASSSIPVKFLWIVMGSTKSNNSGGRVSSSPCISIALSSNEILRSESREDN